VALQRAIMRSGQSSHLECDMLVRRVQLLHRPSSTFDWRYRRPTGAHNAVERSVSMYTDLVQISSPLTRNHAAKSPRRRAAHRPKSHRGVFSLCEAMNNGTTGTLGFAALVLGLRVENDDRSSLEKAHAELRGACLVYWSALEKRPSSSPH